MSRDGVPFVKWAGGKRRLVSFIAERLPLPASRLVEPFAGGAALSLALAPRLRRVWLNDTNADLINLYEQLLRKPADFIDFASTFFRPETNDADTYYALRTRFNETTDARTKAALFLYLNRHGYNGLCRYNKAGRFNVPFGRYKRPYFPAAELRHAARVLQAVTLTCTDFEQVLDACGTGDVVYCDPPYVPLTKTASFTAYTAGGFHMDDQARLARAARRARDRGAFVAISNHDTETTRRLYESALFYPVHVRRTISRDGSNRNEVPEFLAVYAPTLK